MAEISWAYPVSDNFANAVDWNGGVVPGPSDEAILGDLGGSPYTVTVSGTDASVDSIQVAQNATLQIDAPKATGFVLVATDGTGSGVNAGRVLVKSAGQFWASGTINGVGSVELSHLSALVAGSSGLTLSGGGTVRFAYSGRILDSADVSNAYLPGSVTNLSDSIVGDGQIGTSYSLTFNNAADGYVLCQGTAPGGGSSDPFSFNDAALSNAGLIKSKDSSGANLRAAVISNSGTIENLAAQMNISGKSGTSFSLTNSGLIEALSGGTLLFDAGSVDGSGGGVILAGNGSQVRLQSTTLKGGTLKTSGTGLTVTADSGVILDGSASAVNNQGAFSIAAGESLSVVGAINNTGTIALSKSSALVIEAAGATFTGTGKIVMSADGFSHIYAGARVATLTNASTISGTGTISQGVSIINTAGGVIEADNGGIFLHGATIAGGTLKSSGGGAIHSQFGPNVLDGTTAAINLLGSLVINDGVSTTAEGTIANAGTITISGHSQATKLTVGAAGLTLTGKGRVLLGNNSLNSITGGVLTNAGNLILGAGDIGGGTMTLINDAGATIKATDATPLILDTGASTIVNAGTIEAAPGGIGEVMSAVANSQWLYAAGGTLTVEGSVTGTGKGLIKSGVLDFESSFNQIVSFIGTTGRLVLAQSQAFTNVIRGFSKTGGTSLDLKDIAFGGGTTASYSGTTASGVLTVTDGTHTAHIHLQGDYTGSTFTVSSDGSGGTTVVDPTIASAHTLAQAAASLDPRPMAAASPRKFAEPHIGWLAARMA